MAVSGNWGDLGPRIGSAVVMVVVGGIELWLGGMWFHVLVWAICAGMIWELTRMFEMPAHGLAVPMGILGFAALAAAVEGQGAMIAALLMPSVAGLVLLRRNTLVFAAYTLALMLACHGLVALRDQGDGGLFWILWMVSVVIASDVAGYFAGRMIGGPKFWPKVSPKKTWSGTVAGWVLAGAVGAGFAIWAGQGFWLVPVSALVAFFGQMGDIVESAIKRWAGIKDSSNLIPGHGGLLDRFDAMMGAGLAVSLGLLLAGVAP